MTTKEDEKIREYIAGLFNSDWDFVVSIFYGKSKKLAEIECLLTERAEVFPITIKKLAGLISTELYKDHERKTAKARGFKN